MTQLYIVKYQRCDETFYVGVRGCGDSPIRSEAAFMDEAEARHLLNGDEGDELIPVNWAVRDEQDGWVQSLELASEGITTHHKSERRLFESKEDAEEARRSYDEFWNGPGTIYTPGNIYANIVRVYGKPVALAETKPKAETIKARILKFLDEEIESSQAYRKMAIADEAFSEVHEIDVSVAAYGWIKEQVENMDEA